MKPSVGRIVHLSDTVGCVAAIITGVHDDDQVDLTIFPAGALPGFLSAPVGFGEGKLAMTWHWPERVE